MKLPRPIVLISGLLVTLVACGPVRAVAPEPKPNFIAATELPGPIKVDVSTLLDTEVCSHTAGAKDLCVSGLKSAFGRGLEQLVSGYKQGAGEPLTAKFELIELTHAPAAVSGQYGVMAVTLSMRWKLTITDGSGRTVFGMAETTQGPKPLANTNDTAACVGSLENAVLERIAEGLNQSAAPADAPAAPADAPAAPAA